MITTNGVTEGVVFLHNGDYSGNITIRVFKYSGLNARHGESTIEGNKSLPASSVYTELEVPFEDLKMLVANYVRSRKVQELEYGDDSYVLFG